jgi:peptide/nickel transport system ATP-binding protein
MNTDMTPPSAGPSPLSGVDPVLVVDGLTVYAGAFPLVTDVTFTVGRGQRVGVIGASGSGKTLTCMAIAGLLPPELHAAGSIRFAGFGPDMLRASERAVASARGRLTGMVFQEPTTALNPTMRVDRQIAEAIQVHRRCPPGRLRSEVLALLEAVDLPDPPRIARSFPHQLSGGQRQRIVIAIALANNPDLLLCDEPTTALDVSVQARVLDLIDERAAATGAAVLFISHNLAVVASLCDYLLVMWGGRIVERGPVVDVLADPQHEHTRQLLADADLSLTRGTGAAP